MLQPTHGQFNARMTARLISWTKFLGLAASAQSRVQHSGLFFGNAGLPAGLGKKDRW